jgi:hypothetical protein
MNTHTASHRARTLAAALSVAGVLFAAYPAIRPFSDETSLQGARAFASTAWIVSHTLAMLGFIGLTLGLLGVHLTLGETPADRLSFRGLVVSWIGAGLTLAFYGAEAFGLHVIGQEALRQHRPAVLSLANDIRSGPGLVLFVTGLVLLAIGVIMMATAVWRAGTLPRWSAVPLAVGFALYLPQFVAGQPVRVAHGLMVAAGCLWIATAMWRRSGDPATRGSVLPGAIGLHHGVMLHQGHASSGSAGR